MIARTEFRFASTPKLTVPSRPSGCDADPLAMKIVRATISMGRELALRVVAEGIETEAEELMLREAGCDVGQGWRYARALPEADFRTWMAERLPVAA